MVSAAQQINDIQQLLADYSFDFNGCTRELISTWLETFDPVWIQSAIVEALFQGRYKVISVDQILRLWQRRGQAIRHYGREFEAIILGPNSISAAEGTRGEIVAGRAVTSVGSGEATAAVTVNSTTDDAIRPFVPLPQDSEIHHRLQAVVRQQI